MVFSLLFQDTLLEGVHEKFRKSNASSRAHALNNGSRGENLDQSRATFTPRITRSFMGKNESPLMRGW